MFKVLSVFIILLGMGCAEGPRGLTGAPGPAGPSAPVPPSVPVDSEQSKVDALVLDENLYRLSLGQTILSSGLSCTLSTFTSGDRIQSSIAGHNTFAGLSQKLSFLYSGQDASTTFQQNNSSASEGLNLLPSNVRMSYLNMFLVRCQGQLVITESGLYNFELYSDDASLLYINGSKLIDNDNAHGITLVTGSKVLRKGVHTFRLDYAQSGAGSQALILRANGVSIPPKYFFH